MIVASWYKFRQAIDRAVFCYSPIPTSPYGEEGRCGECQGCQDFGAVEDLRSAVEDEVEEAIDEAERASVPASGPRVYRLDIQYPEGSKEPDWEPEGWKGEFPVPAFGDTPSFRWPRERKFLSMNGATHRASLLQELGCIVDIVRSEPIQWPTPYQQMKDDGGRKQRAILAMKKILAETSDEVSCD